MSGVTETRWPLEFRSIDSATVVGGSIRSSEGPGSDLRLVVDLPNEQAAIEVADDAPNQAIVKLRQAVEGHGWLACCNAFHRDASSSAMASGLSCYLAPRWRPLSTSTDLVSSLGPASPMMVIDSATAENLDGTTLPLPKRLAAKALVDTSLGRRLWTQLEERRERQHEALYGSTEVWFEMNDQTVAAKVGCVYRARYRNALSVFFVATVCEEDTVDLRQFVFAVDDPGYTPTPLFTPDNLLEDELRLPVACWVDGPFTAVSTGMELPPTRPANPAEPMTLEELGPKASEALDVYPSLHRTI